MLPACSLQQLGSWGVRCKYDSPKPILGLAVHPNDQEIILLHADGHLRGYGITPGEALTSLWALQGE
jgi:hypothetical protein